MFGGAFELGGDRGSISNKTTLEPIVYPIAFAGVAALTEGLEITEIVAAAVVDWDDMVYCEIFGSAAALTLVGVAIEYILADGCGDFTPWGFIGFHGKSKLMCV